MALTNLGALPTNFAIASSCSAELNQVYKIYTSSEFYLLQGPAEQTSCYPSSYTANPNQYYSPGQCPTGFTSACQAVSSVGTEQETLVRCCPTQASFVCQSTTAHGWEATLGCVVPQDTATTTVWTVSQVSAGRTALVTYSDVVGGINAYQIQVATTTSSTKTKTKTKTTTKTDTHPTAAKPSSSSTGHHGKSKSGLSSGAIAGIAIGVVAAATTAATPLWLKLRKRWQQRNDENNKEDNNDNAGADAETGRSDSEIVHEKAAADKTVEEVVDASDAQSHTNVPRRLSA
ncbi:hypothetical protein F4678DRAFT_271307 [Xylaria arbuscula]|nr:hypothetical protein F4678DRAFT_271307 [Xylaria arbuscula]